MTTAELQKLALSQVVYKDLPEGVNPDTGNPWTIKELIVANYIEKASYDETATPPFSTSAPQLSVLSSMLNWTLVDFQSNTDSGFAGAAFKNTSNEVVFAFRGTEPNLFTNPIRALQDFAQDLQIAMDTSLSGPSQFEDAFDFFTNTYSAGSFDGYSFTGHSLGGALAQYMVYQTNEGGHATTFNAVGIGQMLDGVTSSDYDNSIKDYVNENDVIGQYGTQLGQTIYLEDAGPYSAGVEAENGALALQLALALAIKNGEIDKIAGYAALNAIGIGAGYEAANTTADLLFGAHGLDTLVTSDGASSQAVSGPNLAFFALTQVVNGLFTVSGRVVDGIEYIAVTVIPAVGEAAVEVTIAVIDGAVQVVTKVGEATWNWVEFMGGTTADIVYQTGVTIGGLIGDFAAGIVEVWQVLFEEYVVVNGATDNADTLSAYWDKNSIIMALMGDDTVYGSGRDDIIDGGFGDDYLNGSSGTDYIYGGYGNDTILGSYGTDALFGGAGDDTLYGGDERNWESYFTPEHAADVLDGGAGNDTLQGGGGNDTYIFGKGYGHDTIQDQAQDVVGSINAGFDTLKFLSNVNPSDVAVHRRDNGLEFKIISTGETITDQTFSFSSNYYGRGGIDQVVFADGTIWDKATLLQKARYLYGTETDDIINGYWDQDNVVHAGAGSDVVNGSSGADILYSQEGDDALEGASGNDILDGGTENDILRGGADNDVYVFGRGYGQDTIIDEVPYSGSPWANYNGGVDAIYFNPDVDAEDLEVYRVGMYDLEFRIRDTNDILTVKNHFNSNNAIESVAFGSNGVIWSKEDIEARALNTVGTDDSESLQGNEASNVITGSGGSDSIYGNGGNDTLDGGVDTDYLSGGTGDDTYIFGLGYGVDTVSDSDATSNNTDTIRFLQGISPNDVAIARNGNDIELSIAGTDDKLIVERYFSAYNQSNIYVGEGAHKIERFEFADGTIWTASHIEDVIRIINGTEAGDTIYGYDDLANVITSGDGDDLVYGGSRDDEINAGADNDTVYAGHGNDVLIGGAGNDSLYSDIGNDTLDGGTGDDLLEGGAGNDTYLFGIGHGSDTIYDSDSTEGNQDKIRFSEGVAPEDVRVTRVGENLVLSIIGTSDALTVEKYFSEYARTYGWYATHVGENGNKIEVVEFANGATWSVADVKDKARHMTGTEGDDYLSGFGGQKNIISAGDGNDTIYAAQMGDELRGEAGNDTVYGSSGNDLIVGGVGNDTLEGSAGNDTYEFALGFGTDTIYDSDANVDNIDTISFLGSIAPEDVIVTRNGENLELTIAGNSDKLIIEKYFSEYARTYGWYATHVGPNGNKIERITFTDGTVWTIDTIKDIVRHINGTEGDDVLQGLGDQQNIISGGDGTDVIYAGGLGDVMSGGAGNDTLYGSYGSDTLDGGAGNDTLEGSYGNDTYFFNVGSGNDMIYDSDASAGNQDKIIFGSAVSKEDVTLQRDGDNLVFTFAGSTDTLTIERYFSMYARPSGWSQAHVGINGNKIEQIQFADGTVWNNETVIEKVSLILGTAGADSLTGIEGQQSKLSGLDGDDTLTAASYGDYLDGGAGNDTLNGSYGQDVLRGGTGNDTLVGGAGSDIYAFTAGDGHDTIYDGDSSYAADTISFMEGIDPSDVEASRVGNDLLLKINGGDDDSITIQDYFSRTIQNTGYEYGIGVNKVERITFADGTVWDTVSLEDQFRYITGTASDDTLNGYETDDIITAQEGSDTIHAGTGNDMVDAGAGNDIVYGEAGNDQLSGGSGEDTLDGGAGNDILDGSTGSDILIGAEGSDTYIFRLGDGSDEIHNFSTDTNEVDIVAFQAGVSPQDVTVQRSGDDLVLAVASTADSLTVKGYFSAYRDGDPMEYEVGVNKIDHITFTDGTIWNNRTIEYAANSNDGVVNPDITFGTSQSEGLSADQDGQAIYADEGNDTITGGMGNDVLYGEAGNDTIYGGQGNDILVGGIGNDYLDGSEGNDTYQFSSGFGHDTIADYDTTEGNIDTIAFSSEIVPDDVTLSRVGNNLALSLAAGDSITVQSYFAGAVSGHRKIEQVTFTNGTVWDASYLETAVPPTSAYDNTITGTEYNDYLYGTTGNDAMSGGAGSDTIYSDNGAYDGTGNDLLDGGTGNDMLYGAGGDDMYVFGLGYGQDYMIDEARAGGSYYGASIDAGYDTLKILPGVAPEDIVIRRSGMDLILEITGTTDSMIVGSFFSKTEGVYTSGIERVEFSDLSQTVWTQQDLVYKAQHIEGTSADETLNGYEGQDNIVEAGAGDDILYGASGNDTLDGGTGNDKLEGNYGNDTYVFGVGYGIDTVYDSDSTQNNHDTIQFLDGVSPQDIRVSRNGNNLELGIDGTDDKLIVEQYFSPYTRNGYYAGSEDANKIEQIRFADGTAWSISDVKDKARHINGTNNDDSLYGYGDQQNIINAGEGNDTVYASYLGGELYGEAGNDTLYGSSSADVLDGATGNDILEGATGSDTYIFGRGYSSDTIYDSDATVGTIDTISFLEGIEPADLTVKRNGNDLQLTIADTTDTLTIQQYFSAYTKNGYYTGSEDGNKIEQFQFSDGTVWDIAAIKEKARYISGTADSETLSGYSDQKSIITAGAGNDTVYAGYLGDEISGEEGNDTLYGSWGNDTLNGGAENDILEGSYGSDIYVFGRGYGTDTIFDSDTTIDNLDTVKLLPGIAPSDVRITRNGYDLELRINDTDDKLVVEKYFSPYSRNFNYYQGEGVNKIEQIIFSDDTIWDATTIADKARFIHGTDADETISGYETDDVITAGAGNDTVYTASGNNTVEAGDGNDVVYASSGNDTLSGGNGDDTLYGYSGSDALDGGAGNDLLEGADGNDTYIFGRGYGQDTVYDSDSTVGNSDKIILLEDIAPADIQVRRNGYDLELRIAGTDDKLTLEKYFSPYSRNFNYYIGEDANKVEEIQFANGTIWDNATLKDKARHINGTEADESISGYSDQKNVISAGAGNDTVYASYQGDDISGEAGNDTVYGSSGNDTINGGTGNDILEGSYGNDIYVFGLGDGGDAIYDSDSTVGNIDVISFSVGINPSDVIAKRNGDNLELSIANTTDKLTIERYFSAYPRQGYYSVGENGNKIEQIQFADGTMWDIATIKEKVRHLSGTEGDDSLSGYSDQKNIIKAGAGNDTVYASYQGDEILGEAGDDTIYGSSGEDKLIGGTGNDILEGNYGNDTYVFGLGDGHDTIYDSDSTTGNVDIVTFLEGIAPADVLAKRSGDNLELTIAGTTDKLTIERYFSAYPRYGYYPVGEDGNKVEQFQFADGTIWSIADIKEKVRYMSGTENDDSLSGFSDQKNIISAGAGNDTVYASYQGDDIAGEAGNDTIYGSSGNDRIDGGTGDDILEGNYGNDTYVFGRGYGSDTIYDSDSTVGNADVVTFLEDVAPSDVAVKRTGDNLELTITGTTDKLTVERYFSAYPRYGYYSVGENGNKVEQFHFSDGTIWDIATIKEKSKYITGTENDDTISGFSDQKNVIAAGAGDDTVYASYLGDEISGEAGNDVIHGSSGEDRLIGGTGTDTINGGTGNDSYVFALGDGHDVIYDNDNGQSNGLDVIEFSEGISASDVTARRLQNDDLELTIANTDDKLTIERYFNAYYKNSSWNTGVNSNKIEELRFADGTIWDIAAIKDKVRYISGSSDADSISGFGDQKNIITGNAGDDTIYAASLGDELYGDSGNDTLNGSSGDDLLVGGTGNDRLEGSTGNDTYTFALGDGQDVIYDTNHGQSGIVDVISFSEDISPSDVSVKRLTNDDLELTIAGTNDKLTIERFFSTYYKNSSWNTGADSNTVEEFRFADGTVWNIAAIKDKTRYITGTENADSISGFADQQNVITGGAGDDNLYAGSLGDSLFGNSGNDVLNGSSGNERLEGGAGNDQIVGNTGNDTYIFNIGDGQDVIYDTDHGQGGSLDVVEFGDGITASNIKVKRLPNDDLEIMVVGTDDKLTVERYFSSYYKNSSWNTGLDSNVIEEFRFNDGTFLDRYSIDYFLNMIDGTELSDVLYGNEAANTITGFAGDDSIYAAGGHDVLYGSDGNDYLNGGADSDVLIGGTGNDQLEGGADDDIYVFNAGDGIDTISDSHGGNDVLQFGLDQSSLIFSYSGSDLRVLVNGASDELTIGAWDSNNSYAIEELRAVDGSFLASTQVTQLIQAMASFSSDNNGMSWSQALQDRPGDVQAILAQHWTAPTA